MCLKTLGRGGGVTVSPGAEEILRKSKCMEQFMNDSLENRRI